MTIILTGEPDLPMTRYTTVFLDVDDTLYPSDNGVWEAIGRRINLFMEQRLGIETHKVRQIRDGFLRDYGTTLHGLMANFNADPHEYLDFVHDIPVEEMLFPNPRLRSMLAQLPQRRIVFTNSSLGHVERVVRRLGIEQEIDAIVDLLAMNLHHKPQPEAYRIALAAAGERDAPACLLVDDRIENLQPGAAMGMTTVWVSSRDDENTADHQIELITDLVRAVPELIRV